MKAFKLFCLYFGVLIICSCLSCDLRLPLPILTRAQTITALKGHWKHQDLRKSDVKGITFTTDKNSKSDSLFVWEYQKKDSNVAISDSEIWHYSGIGTAEVENIDAGFKIHFKLVNSDTLLLEDDDLYVKDN